MLILPANSLTGGYEIANSLRFDDGSSDYLSFTPSSAPTSSRIATISFWFKLSAINTNFNFFSANQTGLANPATFKILLRDANGRLELQQDDGSGGDDYSLRTNQLLRDASAWYHLVAAFDTTQATASNRIKLYINGSQVTSFSQENYPTQNLDLWLGDTEAHNIGRDVAYGSAYYDGYMAEFVYIDGQALDPTSFGEFDEDSNIWKPIKYTGTFGTNGFYLDFENSGSLGADASGNGNNFTVNNLTSIDQVTDTPTNNYATLNPLASSTDTTNLGLKNGNLTVDHVDSNYDGGTATFGFLNNMTGKWYWEIRNNESTGASNQGEFAGINYIGSASSTVYDDFNTESYLLASTGSNKIYKKDNIAQWTVGSGFSAGDIINVALDLDNNKIWFGLNGVWYDMSDGTTDGNPATNTNGASISRDYDYLPYFRIYGTTAQLDFNFGNPPFTISSGNSDANGYGNFEYAVPSGYYALNTKNLAEFG